MSRSAHPRPLVAVDVVACTVLDATLHVLLVRRALPPLAWALPGGFVRVGGASAGDRGEGLEAAALRELQSETRLGALPEDAVRLEQIGVFSAPDRDPRTRVISVASLAVVRPEAAAYVRAGSDAAATAWHTASALPPLAFDHDAIVAAALSRLRRTIVEGPLARALVPAAFTAAELRAAVEAVRQERQDAGNFRRRLDRLVERGAVVRVDAGGRGGARFAFAPA